MSYVQTYPSLVTNLTTFMNRSANDTKFASLIPQFVEFALLVIKFDLDILGFVKYVNGVFIPGQPTIQKPANWRTTLSFCYGATVDPVGGIGNVRQPIFKRSYDWARAYAPDDSILGAPKYYADYGYGNFLLTPTPDQAYSFELAYLEMPLPLDDVQEQNWVTQYIPHMLFYQTVIQACSYVENSYKQAIAQSFYDQGLQKLLAWDQSQKTDRQDDITKD